VRRDQLTIYLPLIGLVIFVIFIYSPEITSIHIPVLSGIGFDQKTSLVLTFSLSIFAGVEGYSTYKRAKMEETRQLVDDARNELEKAYGPLYTILNKVKPSDKDKDNFWLEFEERKRIDEIMATYPFMFPHQVYSFWQEEIRNPHSLIKKSDLGPYGEGIDLAVYLEFGALINEEYDLRVKKYNELLERGA